MLYHEFNPFPPNVPFFYPLKHHKTSQSSDVFRGQREGALGTNGLLTNLSMPRGGSRTASTSKVELFVIIINGFWLLTIITKKSPLDVAAVLDLPLQASKFNACLQIHLFKNISFK